MKVRTKCWNLPFSQPVPEMKKYLDFQSQKEEGNPKTTQDFLS